MPKQELKIEVQVSLYGLEALYLACYALLDRVYLKLEGDPASTVRVVLRAKEAQPAGLLKKLEGEFSNELLHQALRVKIAAENRKIREHIVTQALASAEGVKAQAASQTSPPEPVLDAQLEAEIEKLLAEVEKGEGGDPLKIAVPWEEKHAPAQGMVESKASQEGQGGQDAPEL